MATTKPKGVSPDKVCQKVVYYLGQRKELLAANRKLLGDLIFSKNNDEIQQLLDTTATDAPDTKQALQELLENNLQIVKNLNDRIVRPIFFGQVKNAKKVASKAHEYAKLLETRDVLCELLGFFEFLAFDIRQSVEKLFKALVQQNYNNFIRSYFLKNVERILNPILMGGFLDQNIYSAVSAHMVLCSSMLRSCLQVNVHRTSDDESSPFEKIYDHIITMENLECLISLSSTASNFEIASNAMATLKEVMLCDYFGKYLSPVNEPLANTKDQKAAKRRRRLNYLKFVRAYQTSIINLTDYSIVVPMLNGLSEMLLKRSNHTIMMKYISNKHNLKVILEALRRKSRVVRSEAFHILKIFVVNPKPSFVIRRLLASNADQIITTLDTQFDHFRSDGDETLVSELEATTEILKKLHEEHVADKDPSYFVIVQAEEEAHIGLWTSEEFYNIWAQKQVEAYKNVWGSKFTAQGGNQEIQDARRELYDKLRNKIKISYEYFVELVDSIPSPDIVCTSPNEAAIINSFDIIYRYQAFSKETEANIYLEDILLENRTMVVEMPPLQSRFPQGTTAVTKT